MTDLIDRPRAPPWGARAPGAALVPPARWNAGAAARGVRLRSIPFKPEKVKAALAQI